MADYIEREATLAFLREVYCADCKGDTRKTICRICNINDVIDSVAHVPAADVTPVVHGKWISTSKMYGVYSGRCSVCGLASGMWHINQPYKYCPYCGAKMDGGADE